MNVDVAEAGIVGNNSKVFLQKRNMLPPCLVVYRGNELGLVYIYS